MLIALSAYLMASFYFSGTALFLAIVTAVAWHDGDRAFAIAMGVGAATSSVGAGASLYLLAEAASA